MTETTEDRIARYAAESIAEDEAVTDEMLQAARRATRPEDDCPPDELIARIYRAMRQAKRLAEEADAVREFLL